MCARVRVHSCVHVCLIKPETENKENLRDEENVGIIFVNLPQARFLVKQLQTQSDNTDSISVKCSAPQGTTLGPCLFLLCIIINDLMEPSYYL